jgi:hypothetical protein
VVSGAGAGACQERKRAWRARFAKNGRLAA